MSHASWAAGCTAVDGTRLSITNEPPRRRTTNTTSPARIDPTAIHRRIEARLPRAIHRATAQRAIGRSQSHMPRNFRI